MIVHHKPQNRKSCQRTAHYLAEASLLSFPLPVVPRALYNCPRARALFESEEASAEERANFPIRQFRRYLEDLKNVVNHLYDQGTLLILGDFNSHIGTHGGPRSLPAINHSGLDLINVIERMDLLSSNSQNFCRDPVATYFASQGTITTTTDHIFMKKETVELVTDCHV